MLVEGANVLIDPVQDFQGKHVVILGLARQGVALVRFFLAAGAHVTVSDLAAEEKLAGEMATLAGRPVRYVLGGHPLSLLDGCDLLCLSGGVPMQIDVVQAAVARQIRLSNDALLTVQLARARGLGPLIAITGSSGKTTTTTLVGEMLAAAGKTVHVGGNIGTPLVDRLDQIQPGEPIVLELSSFQLELMDAAWAWGPVAKMGPDVAAIVNITPNHLDRHVSMAAYAHAKLNLLRMLPTAATVVLNADDPVTGRLAPQSDRQSDTETTNLQGRQTDLPAEWQLDALLDQVRSFLAQHETDVRRFSRRLPFTHGAWLDGDTLMYQTTPLCRRDRILLRGEHNVSNLLAAALISGAAGATPAAMARTAERFAGVPHRLEVVSDEAGVIWINDSIATSPERAMAALRSFNRDEQTLILLAGGKDKNLPWEDFADEVLARVEMLIGFGAAGAMIVRTVQERAEMTRRKAPNCAVVQRLDEAVALAHRVAGAGTVILLSPGGTSYDAYRDFEARGEHFRRLVHELSGRR